MHQASADTTATGSIQHADADQLEVPSQPRLGDAGFEHLERVVGPPLAVLTRGQPNTSPSTYDAMLMATNPRPITAPISPGTLPSGRPSLTAL